MTQGIRAMEDPTFPLPNLPNDLIIEILTRLPVKPLLKFKCVCKSWRALISSQQFVAAHLENSKSDPNLAHDRLILQTRRGNLKHCSVNSMLCESVSEASDLSCPFQSEVSFWMEASCNGLILLSIGIMNLVLWNPSTRASKKLPHFTGELDMDSAYTYSLFYDKSGDDYKVVGCFDANLEMLEVVVLVYSLRTDQWKRINDINGYNLMKSRVAYANGKLYWIAYPDYEDESEWDILSLDLVEEEHEILKMPSYVKIGEPSSLHVFEGSLHLLCSHWSCADVWIMDGCGVGVENWTKVVTIPDRRLRHTRTMLLYVLRNGAFMFRTGASFVVYDAKDCSFRYPEIKNVVESHHTVYPSYTYVESLVSPMG